MNTRRNFIVGTITVGTGMASLALLGTRALGAGPAKACYDPDLDPSGQSALRKAVEYTEHSADPNRRCNRCAFASFANSACGTCQMFSGGPVNPGGVCTSFAAK